MDAASGSNRPDAYHVDLFLENHGTLEKNSEQVMLAGRVMSMREHGGSLFVDLFDGAKGQCYVQRDKLGESSYDLFGGTVDTGDIVEFTGMAFTTKRGVPSLNVTGWRMLASLYALCRTSGLGLKMRTNAFANGISIFCSPKISPNVFVGVPSLNVIRSYLRTRFY